VSPSWRDRLRVGLCPDRVLFAGYRRGLRPRLGKKQIVALDSPETSPWSAAVGALPALLASAALRKPQVTVVLSNHFVRYAVLPWNAALKTESAWLALARHRFASVHGPAAENWVVRLSGPSFRGARIAAATDGALLEALEKRIEESQAAFESAQPYLMAAFNRACRAIGKESCWLVVDEPGRLTLGLILEGSWHAVRSRRADGTWPETLGEILERESAVLGLEQPCTRVALYTERALDTDLSGDFHLRDLTLPAGSALADRQLAMVLA
jgi:hypothetical protein